MKLLSSQKRKLFIQSHIKPPRLTTRHLSNAIFLNSDLIRCNMYGYSLRFGEAANLMWNNGNIDFIKSKINLSNRNSKKELPPFRLKNHQARTIHAPNWVMEPLQLLKDISSPDSPFVFLNPERLGYVKAKWQGKSKTRGVFSRN